MEESRALPATRRAAAVLSATLLDPSPAVAQTPRRGGTLALRLWDPPHWDPYLILAFKTQIPYTFTHSRLLKHRAGPAISPGTFAIEGDLAESWSQPDETTYVFKLRKGVRFHPKPPIGGRELTAEDVLYSVERFRTVKGNPQAYMLAAVDKVEAVDRHTVKEPFAWFLDMIANPMTSPTTTPATRVTSPRSTIRSSPICWCASGARRIRPVAGGSSTTSSATSASSSTSPRSTRR